MSEISGSVMPPIPSGEERHSDEFLANLERDIFYTFKDKQLLRLALTHESFSNEHDTRQQNNERLEFLGDSVLGCIVCLYLYTHLPQQPEGTMAQIKSYVASTQFLAEKARAIDLGQYILLGHGEDSCQGRNGANILADAMEAVIGAIYLDGGFEPAQKFVLSQLSVAMSAMEGAKYDYKSRLQEYTQRLLHTLPEYETVSESGPPHDRMYKIAVHVGGTVLGEGEGHRKKDAGKEAAAQACHCLDAMLGFDLQMTERLDGVPSPADEERETGKNVANNAPNAAVQTSIETKEDPAPEPLTPGTVPAFILPMRNS